jgi:hypothetical protein
MYFPVLTRLNIIILFLLGASHSRAQVTMPSDSLPSLHRDRAWVVGGTQAALWTGTLIVLNEAWYKNYPKEPFHFFNDWPEWQQQDKLGHAWTTYQVSRVSSDLWRWAGLPNNKAAWIGGLSSIAYLSIIEVLDGFSAEWGFSTGDMTMNILGAALYTGQQIGWRDQKFQLKLSYRPYPYLPGDEPRADELFGTGAAERLLKDYNGQTYWLSFSPASFSRKSWWPAWLNLAVGHNARLMLGGRENTWTDENGNMIDRTDAERYRRFFLSLDLDLTRIPTKSKALKTVFSVLSVLKFPAPAIELDSKGRLRGHWLYY